MEANEMPEADETIVERVLIRWGLVGVVAGLAMLNVGIFYLWRYALSFFYPGARTNDEQDHHCGSASNRCQAY